MRSGEMRRAAWVVIGVLGGCTPMLTPNYRSLHEVDGTVVQSPPPAPAAYEAYLRARLALDFEPPQLEVAEHYIKRALQMDPRDPHLWATRAEIEAGQGKVERARDSAQHALAIRPGYAPAEQVLAKLGAAGAKTAQP